MSLLYFLNHYLSKKLSKTPLVLGKPNSAKSPTQSIYNFTFKTIDGKEFNFDTLKGKKILIVNTASACSYTKQYSDLEKLHQQQKEKLVVIGFPANNFLNQESEDNAEIATFCQKNFGVTFPIMQKSDVRGSNTNEIFRWLSDPKLNGWNKQKPKWNFAKYLINEEGELIAFFGSAIGPMEKVILEKL